MKKEIISFSKPAEDWHEAFPLGNGRIGAMVFGGVFHEKICLNEDSLWSGYPHHENTKPEYHVMQNIKDAALNDNYESAYKAAELFNAGAKDIAMYLPFGNLRIDIRASADGMDLRPGYGSTGHEEIISNYRRELNLKTAVASTSYCINGCKTMVQCFISRPDEILVWKLSSEASLDICIYNDGGYLSESYIKDKCLFAKGKCPGESNFTITQSLNNNAQPEFSECSEEKGMEYAGCACVYRTDGRAEYYKNYITVKSIHELIMLYGIRTGFNGYNVHPYMNPCNYLSMLKTDINNITGSYNDILNRHLEEYENYYNRVDFQLNMPVKHINEENTDALNDEELTVLLFNYGRYLLISSSRPETQPANLQGLWNENLTPIWFSAYALNINLQMNYWMTGSCALHEMIGPLLTLCRELMENGRNTARIYFGTDGACCFQNTDIWRKTSPSTGDPRWSYWPMGYAWLCRNLYDEAMFFPDKNYMAEIEPILKENVLFFENMLTETEDGLVLAPATSPENQFIDPKTGKPCPVAAYSENCNAIIRNLLRDYIELCGKLKLENEVCSRAEKVLPKMKAVQIGSKGQIIEWNKEFKEEDIHHRHLSHLYELFPGRGITCNNKALMDAAEKSMELRGDGGTGWILAWKMIMWARLGKGNHNLKLINSFIKRTPAEAVMGEPGGIYDNLLCASPPFQIDGNLGFTAAIAEMLLQSQDGTIILLPALPTSWSAGTATGLRARGGYSVSIWWDSDTIKYTIMGKPYSEIKLKIKVSGIPKAEVLDEAGILSGETSTKV